MDAAQHPRLIKSIQPEWLKTNGFHEIETNVDATSTLLSEDHSAQEKLKEVREDDDDAEMTHSVAVNIYPATTRMPQLTIVVVDTIPIELKRSYMVWSWFVYVLAANLLLVIPLLWIAAGGAYALSRRWRGKSANLKIITAKCSIRRRRVS